MLLLYMDRPNKSSSSVRTDSDVLFEISSILDVRLPKETLATLHNLIELGVNPDCLALIVSDLRNGEKV